jgi:hypothetical protein
MRVPFQPVWQPFWPLPFGLECGYACEGLERDGAGIGDVFLTTRAAFDTYGIGKLETLDVSTMANDLGYKTSICTTGNCLDKTDKDDESIITEENDATVKDMEAAAIA